MTDALMPQQREHVQAPSSAGALKRLLSRGSLFTIGMGGQALATFVATPFLTHLLTASQFGLVATAVGLSQIVLVIGTLGLPAAIVRHFFHPTHGLGESRSLVRLAAVAAVCVGGLFWFTSQWWIHLYKGVSFSAPMRLALIVGIAGAIGTCCGARCKAADNALLYVICGIIRVPVGVVIGLILAWRDMGAGGYLLGLAIGATASALIGVVSVMQRSERRSRADYVPAALRLSLPALPHAAALYLLAGGDRIIVERAKGIESMGRYQVAYQLGSAGFLLMAALNEAWAPILYKTAAAHVDRLLVDTLSGLAQIACVIAACVALLAPFALRVIMPHAADVAPVSPLVGVIAMSIVPYLVYLAAMNVIFYRGRSARLAVTTPVVMVTALSLSLVMTHVGGLLGASIASTVGYTILGVASWFGASMPRSELLAFVRRSGLFGIVGLATVAGIVAPSSHVWDLPRVMVAGVAIWFGVRQLRSAIVVRPVAEIAS